ncbi:MAG: structural protein P5 [Lentimicrobiaceae bacterium]|jgi:hypothetical protein|nr:structural protein P5 [Lentimicrobiaceae bacterium]
MANLPRGLRNNNPGNIIKGGEPYKGEKVPSSDTRFRQFISIEWGYRALIHLLCRYIEHYKRNTIEKIISAWAPDIENDTEEYIADVVSWTGISRSSSINVNDTEKLVKIAMAISRKENGIKPSESEIRAGLQLLLSGKEPDNNKKKT